MKSTRRSVLAGTAAVLAAPLARPVRAQSALTLKMAHIYPPGNVWTDAAEAFGKAVESRSNGQVRMQIAHSASTGDYPQAIEGLKIGTNDIVLQSIGTLDRYNILPGVEAFPYLLRDVDHFRKVYYGPVGAEFIEEVAKKTGFRLVGAGYRGARWLTTNKPVSKPDDIKGLKLRTPPLKMYRMTWELLGASPVPMGMAELFTSMQQGVVDGQENPLETVDSLKFFEVQKYAVDTRHIIGAMTFIFSDARVRRLPADVQKLLREEGDKAMLATTERMVGMEAGLRTKLQKAGMTINDIDRAELQRRVEPIGKEFPDLVPWVSKFRQAT